MKKQTLMTAESIKSLSEDEKYALGIYHQYNDDANYRKLRSLYGKLLFAQDETIRHAIVGRHVLDVGSGYGGTTRHLRDAGFEVAAIDPCARMRELAKSWYEVDVIGGDIHATSFLDNSFDTILVRESAEHLECEIAFREMDRIGKGVILIFQTNLCPVVRFTRLVLGHDEFNPRALDYYQRLLRELGYSHQKVLFRDVFAFPLSGGYLTRQLFPEHDRLQNWLIAADEAVAAGLRAVRCARWFCWRFLLRATKEIV